MSSSRELGASSHAATSTSGASSFVMEAADYLIDAGQRWVLFLDVLRRRGNTYLERLDETAPHALHYGFELLVDGRKATHRKDRIESRIFRLRDSGDVDPAVICLDD